VQVGASPQAAHRDCIIKPEPHLISRPVSPGWWNAKSAGPADEHASRTGKLGAGEPMPACFLNAAVGGRGGEALVVDLSWQAHPLAVARPGTPTFEIEYPSDAQSLGELGGAQLGARPCRWGSIKVFVDDADAEPTPRV
jgi:hypothetical protein